jgi:hypothetical protein
MEYHEEKAEKNVPADSSLAEHPDNAKAAV